MRTGLHTRGRGPRIGPMLLRTLTILLGLALVITAVPQEIRAQASERGPQPGDYFFWEFAAGSLGGWAVSSTATESILSSWCKEAENPELCRRAGRVALRPVIYPLLVFAGTTVGIFTVGALAGVEGNLAAALIGSFAGTLAGLVEAALVWNGLKWLFGPGAEQLVSAPETPEYLKRTVPLVIEFLRRYEETLKELAINVLPAVTASFWGTLGFNLGARLRSP